MNTSTVINNIKNTFFTKDRKVLYNYTIASVIRTFSIAISNIIILRWISPDEIGIYNSLNVLIAYSFFSQLGVFTALNRQIPYLLGQAKREQVDTLVKTGIAFAKGLSIASLLIGLIIALLIYLFGDMGVKEFKMLITIILLVSISFYQNYLNVTYRTSKNFNVLSLIYIATSIMMFLSLFFVYCYSYDGLVLFYFFNAFTFLVLTHLFRPFKLKSSFSKRSFLELIKIGLPLFTLGYLQQVSKTFNRMILLAVGSVYLVGLFSPATAIFTAIAFLPTTLAQFLYPKFSFLYGKYNDPKILIPYVNKIYIYTLILVLPSIIASITVIPWAVDYFFPKYHEGILSTQLFLISGVINISTISINVFYSIGNKKSVTIYTLIKIAIMFLFPILLLPFFDPLTAVSIGTLIALISISIIGYYLLIHTLNGRYS